ncbi:hypothetical protein D9M72_568910 [compost metagenome]
MHDILADKRFAACQAQFANTLVDECAANPVEFLERQQVFLRQKSHVLRHAICAAEVTTISD